MAKKTFETALSKLEKITEELEAGELSLENSLKKFDEGIQLVNFCNAKLDDAKNRVEILLNKNGAMETQPFSENDIED
jgi:exodeoxyribonuclease VII small subunit